MLKKSFFNQSAGFVLLEALIAIAIFSFALLGLMGMQALSIKNSADAKYRADAAYLANQLFAQMWVDRANIANYAYRPTETACADSATTPNANMANWLADTAAVLPGVKAAASSKKPQVIIGNDVASGATTVTITICWRLPSDPGTSTHNHVAIAKINS